VPHGTGCSRRRRAEAYLDRYPSGQSELCTFEAWAALVQLVRWQLPALPSSGATTVSSLARPSAHLRRAD
jgi:hypothetical protein